MTQEYFACLAIFLLVNNVHGYLKGMEVEEDMSIFTYMVMVDPANGPLCSGSIIGDYFILTAAHCVCDFEKQNGKEVDELKCFKNPKIIAGANKHWKFHNFPKPFGVERDVERVYVPKAYLNRTTHNIAVLKLKESLDLKGVNKDRLTALKLPKYNTRWQHRPIAFAGYGVNALGTQTSGTLRYVGRKYILGPSKCDDRWWKHLSGRVLEERHDLMCIEVETCTGDDGSPAVLRNVALGVESYHDPSCASYSWPPLFTTTGDHLDMLHNVMNGTIAMSDTWVYTPSSDEIHPCEHYA